METLKARWYFDVISPFAYLHLKQFKRLNAALEIDYVPVLFAGLLKAWGTKGPAELPAKRIHTYRQCVWLASKLGLPFRMPPRHPFNPLSPLRLLVALKADRHAIERTFDFIWGEGRDPEIEFPALCEVLKIDHAAELISTPAIKAELAANTEGALALGVWGVPTFALRNELFWGADTIEWMNAYVDDPLLFQQAAMRRADTTGEGVVRRQ